MAKPDKAETSKRRSETKRDYAGILPKKGWPRRNYHFLRRRLLPQMFKKSDGTVREPIPHPPEEGKIRVTWIGHASFLVQFADHSVIIDPNWANWHGVVKRQRVPGLDLSLMPLVDLVMVTHAHFDHLHKRSLKILESHEGIVVPQGSGSLVKRLGFKTVHEMSVWDELKFGDLNVTHTPSHHWGARYLHDTHRDYGGYMISSGVSKVFHCGDSAYFEGFKEIGKHHTPDVALMPIGAYDAPSGRDVHMNPEEAVRSFIEMKAGILIPMHYGTFPLGNEPDHEPVERLVAEAERLGVADRVLVLEEGIGIEVECLAETKS
ncbi:MBL fold metallo-hydrolase [Verrucomicrobiaceae bacterium 5K15]|uniref:MBL fold metallo-hydrolase n=1 Tax=Oceaniferula flava TaxID=2800421 RepID=A0AAE2SAJ3_9BACT|nr:MBL fold metallo-hydrolase [Oceaniferula flavus]MBK1854838.1 MBL fold metallo-hydrolase [Oceaniferula flavus]MBM1136144.1 MBL fold metallo-hydrolase [Oceaniferula flavus]